MPALPELSVSEFVALVNQTLEFAYAGVTIVGELANFRVAKNKWIYFDLKDNDAIVRFFGTVYQLPGPLENGLMLKVKATPQLHRQYGLSLNVISIIPIGEGSIKRAAGLLEVKLASEGLFDSIRKRSLPYPPTHIGLITSLDSAAYSDFIKVLKSRWTGMEISVIDVQVQGDLAAEQIVGAIAQFNQLAQPPAVLVITRGGGSAEDLMAFSSESLTRAVAASRIPTLVAVGHERDTSLAELAADQRASTPSNAAELLVPDKTHVMTELQKTSTFINEVLTTKLKQTKDYSKVLQSNFHQTIERLLRAEFESLNAKNHLMEVLNPVSVLSRGYALVRKNGEIIKEASQLKPGDLVNIALQKGQALASIEKIGVKSVQ